MNPESSSPSFAPLQYRADIDGLRAIAVFSVIIFHINGRYLPGGFLGVDIFFVISGYLITLLLAKAIAKTGQLNLIDFYRRRIKRIFPALLFMLAATLVAGYVLMAPTDYATLSTSVIWALFSAANIYFFSAIDTGYFASGSEELPLLHLWSLGIEEQFYIVWPFIVAMLIKSVQSATTRLWIISVALLVSLALAQLLLHQYPSFTYYMLPTRAWELMAGGVAAFLAFTGLSFNKKWSIELLTTLAIAAIVWSICYVTKNNDVPGLGAVPAVLGSAIILFLGHQTTVGRLLSLKPLVAMGVVSYSAYLWHWPILAFLRYALVKITLPLTVIVVVATFIMASISYFCIEHPLRLRKCTSRNVFVWYFSVPVATIAVLALCVVQLIRVKAVFMYPWHKYDAVSVDTRPASEYDFNCQYNNFQAKAIALKQCVFPVNTTPSVLLVGDSHAAHYLGMLRVFAQYYGFSIRNASQSACPLLLNSNKLSWVNKKYAQGCDAFRATVKTEFVKYDTVIIGGTWNTYDHTGGKAFRTEIKSTLDTLSNGVKNVIILANIPIISNYNRECQVRSVKLSYLNCVQRHLRHADTAPVNNYLQHLSETYSNVYFFNVRSQLCKGQDCSPYFNGKPVYFNSTHLTLEGSEAIGTKMLKDNDPSLSIFKKIGSIQ